MLANTINIGLCLCSTVIRNQGAKATAAISANTNATVDIGPMQVNQIWIPQLAAHWHATAADTFIALRDNFCANVEAGASILRQGLAATGLTEQETADFLHGYIAKAEHVIVRRRVRPSIKDPSDEMFVEALLNGGGEAIVTFNRRDYLDADHSLASQGKAVVPVISPGETLRRLTWRPTATTHFAFPRR